MLDYKLLFAVISIIIGVCGYVFYYKDIFRGKTKPHAFSWLVWAVLAGIAFFGQISDRGGYGAWVSGLTTVACLSIFIVALWKGEKNTTLSDKLSLLGAGVALLLWYITNDALASVILITVIYTIGGFYPTIRKSYSQPQEETLLTYFFDGIKWLIALFALENYSIITALYPLTAFLVNSLFVGLLIVRRSSKKKIKNTTLPLPLKLPFQFFHWNFEHSGASMRTGIG